MLNTNNNFKPYSVLFISNIKFPLHCNFHLHSTVTLTVAVAGVSTPLLAVHWYWIMLSAVPGLLTFTIVSDGETERTSELPILVHDMLGSGLLDTLQLNEMLLPSLVTITEIDTSTDGATKIVT